jgi:hypothetical protein
VTGQTSITAFAANLRSPLTGLLSAVFRSELAGELARLRRSEVQLAHLVPHPTLVAMLGITSHVGTSTLAALLGQALTALAPGRVAMLDGDGNNQALRTRLGTDNSGGLRQMLIEPRVWRTRRLIDQYLAQGGNATLLAAAAAERGRQLSIQELDAALVLLRRRFPVVIADLPVHAAAARYEPIALAADHVVVVGQAESSLEHARQWIVDNRPGRQAASLTVAAPQAQQAVRTSGRVDVWLPADPALARVGPVHLAGVQLQTLAAVEALACRVTTNWR